MTAPAHSREYDCKLDYDSVKYANTLCSICWGVQILRCGCNPRYVRKCKCAKQMRNLAKHILGRG